MKSDILGEYGPDKMPHIGNKKGGEMEKKQLPYSPPVGPKGIMDSQSPGLHGTNHGNCGTQRCR